MNMKSLRKIVKHAIEEYHEYRSDTDLRVLSMDEKSFKIAFSGEFCHICGVANDYQLVQYFLEGEGVNADVTKVTNFDDGFVADFNVVKQE